MVSAIALQWTAFNASVAQQLAAIALPMIVVCEVLGVLLAATALWRSGDAHRGVGRAALQRGGSAMTHEVEQIQPAAAEAAVWANSRHLRR
jgi:hypothetical protein